jgi:hypothetical protein
MPLQKLERGAWLHPTRLPLGAGWSGRCSAPGHEGAEPADEELRDFCNLGYAVRCSRLPAGRACDAVRFSVNRDLGSLVLLCFVCEMDHRPVAHGILEFDLALERWVSSHPDPRIQRMAECYMQCYRSRRIQPAAAGVAASVSP